MITAIFYKEVNLNTGLGLDNIVMERQEIATGKTTIEEAYLVALEHGCDPEKNIQFREDSLNV